MTISLTAACVAQAQTNAVRTSARLARGFISNGESSRSAEKTATGKIEIPWTKPVSDLIKGGPTTSMHRCFQMTRYGLSHKKGLFYTLNTTRVSLFHATHMTQIEDNLNQTENGWKAFNGKAFPAQTRQFLSVAEFDLWKQCDQEYVSARGYQEMSKNVIADEAPDIHSPCAKNVIAGEAQNTHSPCAFMLQQVIATSTRKMGSHVSRTSALFSDEYSDSGTRPRSLRRNPLSAKRLAAEAVASTCRINVNVSQLVYSEQRSDFTERAESAVCLDDKRVLAMIDYKHSAKLGVPRVAELPPGISAANKFKRG